jgi:hypothetical protein
VNIISSIIEWWFRKPITKRHWPTEQEFSNMDVDNDEVYPCGVCKKYVPLPYVACSQDCYNIIDKRGYVWEELPW